jgi:hypothetical protein
LQTRVESSGLPKTRCRLRIDLEPASIWGMSAKQVFGVSLEVAARIDASDICAGLGAAAYRFAARMRELEHQFEAKASELRQAYLGECEDIQGACEPYLRGAADTEGCFFRG